MTLNVAPIITSMWPGIVAIYGIVVVFTIVGFLWAKYNSFYCGLIGIRCARFTCMFGWWRDLSREGGVGLIPTSIQDSLIRAIALFIGSEVLFFTAFFWVYFHRINTGIIIECGGRWPPMSLQVINPIAIPILNTTILLWSGVTATWAHHMFFSIRLLAFMLFNRHCYSEVIVEVLFGILLGLYFTSLQLGEYIVSSFTISDSIYGSTFYIATGFHGLHVIIGTICLRLIGCKILSYSIASSNHSSLRSSIWYWHFVDGVWLYLFSCIYGWGS